jgi:hypothetical protein
MKTRLYLALGAVVVLSLHIAYLLGQVKAKKKEVLALKSSLQTTIALHNAKNHELNELKLVVDIMRDGASFDEALYTISAAKEHRLSPKY